MKRKIILLPFIGLLFGLASCDVVSKKNEVPTTIEVPSVTEKSPLKYSEFLYVRNASSLAVMGINQNGEKAIALINGNFYYDRVEYPTDNTTEDTIKFYYRYIYSDTENGKAYIYMVDSNDEITYYIETIKNATYTIHSIFDYFNVIEDTNNNVVCENSGCSISKQSNEIITVDIADAYGTYSYYFSKINSTSFDFPWGIEEFKELVTNNCKDNKHYED